MLLLDSLLSIFKVEGTQSVMPAPTWREDPVVLYALLRRYYTNNALYKSLRDLGQIMDLPPRDMLGLRNPTHAAVEFYAAATWPGTLPDALPIETPDTMKPDQATRLIASIKQVWAWSNWNQRKQVFARSLPMLGDQFMKVATRGDSRGVVNRVFLQLIQPDFVTDFEVDERDFLNYIRIDVPRTRRSADRIESYVHTEIWDKASQTYRSWENETYQSDVASLGRPLRELSFSAFKIDFVPFVHCKFIDDGSQRGVAVIMPALDKIDELNRMATRLHQMLFRHGKPDKQLVSSAVDRDGTPQLPPNIEGLNSVSEMPVTAGGEVLYRIPSGWRIDSIVANLPYGAHLDAIVAAMDDLRQTDLPELLYYQINDLGDMSGRAIRYMMTSALAKAEEVRGNAETALIRAQQMALTIGVQHNLFNEIGTFEAGDFEHWFAERSIVPLSEQEEAEIDEMRSRTNTARLKYGATAQQLLKADGYSDKEIAEMLGNQAGEDDLEEAADLPVVPS